MEVDEWTGTAMITTYRISNGRTVVRLHKQWHPGREHRNENQKF